MRLVITGAAGFIGQALARRILAQPGILAPDGRLHEVEQLILVDLVPAPAHADMPGTDPRCVTITGDLTEASVRARVFAGKIDGVFHLAAVVSSGAEADFELGYRVNLDGTVALLEACRALSLPPVVVFASSCAVFGGDLPDVVPDHWQVTPTTSYGAQKAMGELLVADYARKGFIDGRSLRLPTIVVRPGKPNKAASSFASSILREPLAGLPAICPVPLDARMWILSPHLVVTAFLHGFGLPAARWGSRAAVSLAGLSVSIAEIIASLERCAGPEAAALIRHEPDAMIAKIVAGWPKAFRAERALQLGFQGDADMDSILRAYMAQ